MADKISDEDLAAILAGCKGVTPGPYDVDGEDNDVGGSGRFTSYAIFAVRDGRPITIADTLNADAVIQADGESVWDEQGERNMRHMAHFDPDTVRSIVTELQALRAPHDAGTGEASTHRHKKHGSEYVLIGYGKMQAEKWWRTGWDGRPTLIDMCEVAIYRSVHDGSLWVQPREEFEDGRVEALNPPAEPAGDPLVRAALVRDMRTADVDGDREAGGAAREAIAEFDQRRREAAVAASGPVEAEPVMWRVKGYGDAWWFIHTKAEAEHSASNGNLVQPLYLAPPSAGPVAIEPLEWRTGRTEESAYAESVMGGYAVWTFGDHESYWRSPSYVGTRVDGPLSAAQAAAQADFETRIRSAIVAQPAAEVDPRTRTAAADVIAERRRQVEVEGWTPEHDDQHRRGEMVWAALAYATNAAVAGQMLGLGVPAARVAERAATCPATDLWPWPHKWWKPTGPRRDLVKAGALILAEIERLDRALLKQEPSNG